MDIRASRCAIRKLHATPSRYADINPNRKKGGYPAPNRVTFLTGANRDFPKRRRQLIFGSMTGHPIPDTSISLTSRPLRREREAFGCARRRSLFDHWAAAIRHRPERLFGGNGRDQPVVVVRVF